MVKVFLDSDYCNNQLQAEFYSYGEAETFVNGKLAEHILKSVRNYWTIERNDRTFTITINDMFKAYRIEREV